MTADLRFFLRAGPDMVEVEGEAVIGRSSACHVRIDDPLISRRHCIVRLVDGELELSDLGSRNGVLLNGDSVRGRALLRHGDRISLGKHNVAVLAQRDTPSAGVRRDSNRPTMVEPESTDTKSGDVFDMFVDACAQAIEEGDVSSAESVARNLYVSVRAALVRGQNVNEALFLRTAGFGLELAALTDSRTWLDRFFALHSSAHRLLSAEMLVRVESLVTDSNLLPTDAIRSYVGTLRRFPESIGDRGEAHITRLEALLKR